MQVVPEAPVELGVIVSSKILPQESDKGTTRQTASLIPVEELVRHQQLDGTRSETSAASTTTFPVPAKKKEVKDKAAKSNKPKPLSKRRSDFSDRSPATPASEGAAKLAEDVRSKSQRNNEKKRRWKQAAKEAADKQRADDDDNSGGRGGDSPPAAGSGTPSHKSDKHDKGGAGGSGSKRGSQRGDKPGGSKHKKHHKDKHKGK